MTATVRLGMWARDGIPMMGSSGEDGNGGGKQGGVGVPGYLDWEERVWVSGRVRLCSAALAGNVQWNIGRSEVFRADLQSPEPFQFNFTVNYINRLPVSQRVLMQINSTLRNRANAYGPSL